MKRRLAILAIGLLFVAAGMLNAQVSPTQPVLSEKQDIAIFALGYYGWNIPPQALASIDGEIQKVFSDLGRFTILGVSQRLNSGGLEQFISIVKQAKQKTFVMPEKYQFGEAFLTEAEFTRLVGAFFVVAPVVTEFNSFYNSKNQQYETSIKTNFTFIDVASGGNVLAIKSVSTSGSHKTNQFESVSSAIRSIPSQLQYEVRSIDQFKINTRILSVDGGSVKLQMGTNMGIQKGDEYAIIDKKTVEGFDDSREVGLVVIKDVGREVSSGQVLYSSMKTGLNTQLTEIARVGVEADLYFHLVGDQFVPGFRATASRGFYSIRPYVAVQIPVGLMENYLYYTWYGYSYALQVTPVNALFGAEFVLNLGRLSVAPHAGIGASYFHITTSYSDVETDFLSHLGVQLGGRAAWLFNRNLRFYADAGLEYWLSVYDYYGNKSYGGLMFGIGATYKL